MAEVVPPKAGQTPDMSAPPVTLEVSTDPYLMRLLNLMANPSLAGATEDVRLEDNRWFWYPRTWGNNDWELLYTNIPGIPGRHWTRIDVTLLYRGKTCATATVRYKALVGTCHEDIVDAMICIEFGTDNASAAATCSWTATTGSRWSFKGDFERLTPGTAVTLAGSTFEISASVPPIDTMEAMLASVLGMQQ